MMQIGLVHMAMQPIIIMLGSPRKVAPFNVCPMVPTPLSILGRLIALIKKDVELLLRKSSCSLLFLPVPLWRSIAGNNT
jgi:hypothetical protein